MRYSFLIAAVYCGATLSLSAQSIQLKVASPTVPWLVGAENAGDDRLFLIRQDGFIVIRMPDETLLPTPFLDWSARIKLQGEQGLLGLAFHPDYANNGQFYLYYSEVGSGASVLSRMQRHPSDSNLADPASEQVLLRFPHPNPSHVGGSLKFGPDGYLYLSVGDGGEFGDPNLNSQNPQLYLGKILRLDVNNGQPYIIPVDNPFADNPAYLPEIWCTGLRNPWRMSFDRLTGDTWIGDVGQSLREEVDFIPQGSPGGQNFGWSYKEGTLDYKPYPDTICCFTAPVFEYGHNTDPSCSGSITGGYVYRGHRWNALWGRYLFTDFCTGTICSLQKDSAGISMDTLGGFNAFDYVNISEDNYGELYISGYFSNKLYRIESLDCTPVARIEHIASSFYRCASDTLPLALEAYGGAVSGMQFQWMKNGADLPGETGSTFWIKTLTQSAVFNVRVTNPQNACSAVSNSIDVFIIPDTETVIDTTITAGQTIAGVVVFQDTVITRQIPDFNHCLHTTIYVVHVAPSGVFSPNAAAFSCRLLATTAEEPLLSCVFSAAPDALELYCFDALGRNVARRKWNGIASVEFSTPLVFPELKAGLYTLLLQTDRGVCSLKMTRP